jgi:chromosome segregation ATPase
MTETQTQTQISIPELQKAAREAAQQERQLAQEVDALPEKIQEAARNDARSKARAARSGATVAAVDETSAVPKLRQREAELPFLRWSAAIRTASLEIELNEAQKAQRQAEADEARPELKPAREEMEDATVRFNGIRATVRQAEHAASTHSMYASDARKRLQVIEQEYPGV